MKRLSNIYTALASTAICSLLFFTFVNYWISKRTGSPPSDLENELLVDAHNNQYTIDEIGQLRKEFALTFKYTDVQFEESAREGDFVNKYTDGTRKTSGNELCNSIPQERSIWLFGGSTLYGYGISDEHTIPSYLSKSLKAKTGKDWCVKNFGRGFYYSSQQLVLLVNLLARGPEKLAKKLYLLMV